MRNMFLNERTLAILEFFDKHPESTLSDLNRAWGLDGAKTNSSYVQTMLSKKLLDREEGFNCNMKRITITDKGRRVLSILCTLEEVMEGEYE